ncbi:hypothetical protein DK847_16250 [Aestuariivirga litoralis]|uniref:YjiS-like domain-containing protein n=1 Tax=Aestuariivirga litoralis TaxID=2650924 RepID=A0A2W2BR74_9HYPH|nr:DUF1127 domain-containing protein [Aestuariivirga litoralis]PZF75896.1 hypothetical protein DK847_16250 [Aestuariivirga litoralis]
MRDYALHRAEASEATGSLALLWTVIRNWRARRAVARLDALDDFLLHDIGVTRTEVRWAAGLPLTVNAALELEEQATRRRRRGQ